MSTHTRISKFFDPARGGHPVEFLTKDTTSTVMYPDGLRKVTHTQVWRDVGTLMPPIAEVHPKQARYDAHMRRFA